MKDGKKIIIKNPTLKKFRNNLRALINKIFLDDYNEYNNKGIKLLKNKEDNRDIAIKLEEVKKLRELGNLLDQEMKKSICTCPRCHKTNQDMAYFADWDQWYCIGCFDKNYKDWKKAIEKHRDPDYPFI